MSTFGSTVPSDSRRRNLDENYCNIRQLERLNNDGNRGHEQRQVMTIGDDNSTTRHNR